MTAPHPGQSKFVAEPVIQATLDAWGEAGRCSLVPVTGSSMWPLLLPGDTVWIEHGREDLRIGDVLAYRLGSQLVIHRLLGRLKTGALVLGGDNRWLPDQLVPREAVLGRVVRVEAQGRQFRLDRGLSRLVGWVLAVCFRIRRHRGMSPIVSRFSHLLARVVRP